MGGETRYLVYAGGSVRLPYRQMDWQERQAPFLCGLVAAFFDGGQQLCHGKGSGKSPAGEKSRGKRHPAYRGAGD